MIKFVEYGSVFIWFIFIVLNIYREYKRIENKDIKLILQKPFHLIRIDTIFFLIIFVTYYKFARDDVLPYLFLCIIITNIVYLIYDLIDNYKLEMIKKNDLKYYLVIPFLVVYSIIVILRSNNTITLFISFLIINCLIPIYVSIIKMIKKH